MVGAWAGVDRRRRRAADQRHGPLQGASGQRPDSSPGTNSPLDCSCPGSASAADSLPWRAGTRGQDASDGGAAIARAAHGARPAAPSAECEANCAPHRPVRLTWPSLFKHVLAATSLEYKIGRAYDGFSRGRHGC